MYLNIYFSPAVYKLIKVCVDLTKVELSCDCFLLQSSSKANHQSKLDLTNAEVQPVCNNSKVILLNANLTLTLFSCSTCTLPYISLHVKATYK